MITLEHIRAISKVMESTDRKIIKFLQDIPLPNYHAPLTYVAGSAKGNQGAVGSLGISFPAPQLASWPRRCREP